MGSIRLICTYLQVENLAWKSTKHNMGMAINRTTWHEIKSCAKHFCSYDDYNWDWSLQHANNRCLKTKLTVMMAKGPRVFHIGEWWEMIYKNRFSSHLHASFSQRIASHEGRLWCKWEDEGSRRQTRSFARTFVSWKSDQHARKISHGSDENRSLWRLVWYTRCCYVLKNVSLETLK